MKAWQSSTMPKSYKTELSGINLVQQLTFDQLHNLLSPYAHRLEVKCDTRYRYELWTTHPFRSKSMNPKNKKGILFAGLLMLKSHVGFYFYPLYIDSDYKNSIPQELLPLWSGGSAFKLLKPLSACKELKFQAFILTGWNFYLKNKWVNVGK